MTLPLPAGLLDNHFELFVDPSGNLDHTYCRTAGDTTRVLDAPLRIQVMIVHDMKLHPKKVAKLKDMGYQGEALMEKYAGCISGAYDPMCDGCEGGLNHTEYYPCSIRATCPGADIVCNPMRLKNGVVTSRKVQVLQLVGQGLLNKEIAHRLNISPETTKIHVRDLQRKAGVDNKKELVIVAHQKNLI